MNIILIGPVSGNVEKAKLMFENAEKRIVENGYTVVHNPMRDHEAGHSEAWYIRESLSNICNLVIRKTPDLRAVVLDGGRDSKGSKVEIMLCKKLGIDLYGFRVSITEDEK